MNTLLTIILTFLTTPSTALCQKSGGSSEGTKTMDRKPMPDPVSPLIKQAEHAGELSEGKLGQGTGEEGGTYLK